MGSRFLQLDFFSSIYRSAAKETTCNPQREKASVTNTQIPLYVLSILFTNTAIFICDSVRSSRNIYFPVSLSFQVFFWICRFSSHYNLQLITSTRLYPTDTGGHVPNSTIQAQSPAELFSRRFWHTMRDKFVVAIFEQFNIFSKS